MVKLKRVYREPEGEDGFRILIDRLWPRGLSKERARIDLWLKDIAPGNDLRKWFQHDPAKWPEFLKRYRAELELNRQAVDELESIIGKEKQVTLLYSAKDEEHNNAVALKQILKL